MTNANPAPIPEPDVPSPRVPYSLLGMVHPYGREDVPDAFDRGEAAFDAASAEYARGAYVEAARGFVAAADALVTESDNTYASNFSHNRSLAYENAARASQMADRLDLGRDLLRAAADRDAECAPAIERIIDQILSA